MIKDAPIRNFLHDTVEIITRPWVRWFTTATHAIQDLQSYGEMYLATTQSITATTQDIWYQVTGFTDGHEDGFVLVSGDDFVVGPGDYVVTASISVSSVTANQTAEFSFAINGVVDTNHSIQRKFGTAGQTGALSITGVVDVEDDDSTIGLYFRNLTSDGKQFDFIKAPFIISMIHR